MFREKPAPLQSAAPGYRSPKPGHTPQFYLSRRWSPDRSRRCSAGLVGGGYLLYIARLKLTIKQIVVEISLTFRKVRQD